ncbi:MAG: hypothetical protein M3Q87_11275 [Actinomycetota bacterium]|nr:hypothetical protein [Actinomycetota bacterium]
MTSLSDTTLRGLASAGWWLFVATFLIAGALASLNEAITPSSVAEGLGYLVVLLPFPLTGLLVLRRQPRNTIGWVLTGIGLVWSIGGLADSYARYGLIVDPGSLPEPAVAATVANATWVPALGLMGTFLLLLFPDGHLPSPRWRPVAWVCAATVVTLTVVIYPAPGELEQSPVPGLSNPLAIEGAAQVFDVLFTVLLPLFALCILASAAGVVRRFRRSRGVERQQLKWLAAAGAVVASVFLIGIFGSRLAPPQGEEPLWQQVLNQASFLAFALIPVSIGVAILRHRLYDIDVVIKRTLVYALLTATLVGVYLGSVLLLQLLLSPLTQQSDLAVAGSTLAVAGLVGPARRRIQRAVDRRFYRSRYDASLTIEAFAVQLRHELDVDAVGVQLQAVVNATMQPTGSTLWLRS